MNGSWRSFREKELICVKDGKRLGQPVDLEFDGSGQISAVIACAPALKPGQFFSRPKRYRVCWKDLCRVGDELLLVDCYEADPPANVNKM